MSPEALLQLCAQGDSGAWETLVQIHQPRVFNTCRRFTRCSADAQDLTQEVFLRVFRTANTFRFSETGSVHVWMTRMTRNLLIDNYRRKRRDRLTGKLVHEPLSTHIPPDHLLVERERHARLNTVLGKLPPLLREALILREIEEMDYRQIAAALGMPEGTVKSRLNRARAELARLVQKHA